MSLDQQTVTEALKQVIDPNTGKDFVAGRSIRNLAGEGGRGVLSGPAARVFPPGGLKADRHYPTVLSTTY